MKISPIADDSNNSTFVGFLGSQKNETQLVKLRLLLIRLLQSSQLYSPDILLQELIKAGPLNIEKVIVYGRVKYFFSFYFTESGLLNPHFFS